MFVSNSDNLGATMDLKLLTWFVEKNAPFAMECAARTEADKKGGHLAKDVKHGDEIRTRAATATPRPSAVAATSTALRPLSASRLRIASL